VLLGRDLLFLISSGESATFVSKSSDSSRLSLSAPQLIEMKGSAARALLLMDSAGYQLFPGARFACDKDSQIAASSGFNLTSKSLDR